MPFAVGETVGAYRLVEQLGPGEMTTVFKAHHAALQRYVAIKILNPFLQDQLPFVEMFRREAVVVAKLNHPNIVPVYDFAEHEGLPYLVMKYLECEPLTVRLTQGAMPLAEVARILGAIGSALTYAHGQGVTHRDLRPSNVLIEAHGDVSLTDFSLARLQPDEASDPVRRLVIRSADYLSPEQAGGVSDPDALSDQYALGVLTFQMSTGQLPFTGATGLAVMQQQAQTTPPRPSALKPDLPPLLDDVILRALAKTPAARFPNITDLVTAFQQAVAPPRPLTAPIRMTPPRGVPVSPPPAPDPFDIPWPEPPLPTDLPWSGKTPEPPTTILDSASLDSDSTKVLSSEGLFGQDISIMLVLQPSGQLFFLSGKTEYWLGRSEPTKPFVPDLDLAEHRSMEQGVSRRHGVLRFENTFLFYTDLNSSNGSRVNGEKLRPEIPIVLNDGDELCLGRMVFRIYFTV